MTYNSVVSATKKYIERPNLSGISCASKQIKFQPPLNLIIDTPKGASAIYQVLIESHDNYKGCEKWQLTTQITATEWQTCFKTLKSITHDPKLRWLQFRIMHHILTTNRSVSKFNAEQNHLCEFCKAHSETIHHLLWKCHKVQIFWNELLHTINNRCNFHSKFFIDEKIAIFGIVDNTKTDTICNFIILLAKFYIYRSKVQKNILSTKIFLHEVYTRYCVEKTIHKNALNFVRSWEPYQNLFRGLV